VLLRRLLRKNIRPSTVSAPSPAVFLGAPGTEQPQPSSADFTARSPSPAPPSPVGAAPPLPWSGAPACPPGLGGRDSGSACGSDSGCGGDDDSGSGSSRDGPVAGLLIVPACSAASRPLRAGCAGASGGRSQPGLRLRAPVGGWLRPRWCEARTGEHQWHSSSLT
jgi:hypothetical protein